MNKGKILPLLYCIKNMYIFSDYPTSTSYTIYSEVSKKKKIVAMTQIQNKMLVIRWILTERWQNLSSVITFEAVTIIDRIKEYNLDLWCGYYFFNCSVFTWRALEALKHSTLLFFALFSQVCKWFVLPKKPPEFCQSKVQITPYGISSSISRSK